MFSSFIFQSFNHVIDVSIFPTALKSANIVAVFRKESKNSKENYRSVSILPNTSKLSERYRFSQCKYQCGFRQGLSAQYGLMSFSLQLY